MSPYPYGTSSKRAQLTAYLDTIDKIENGGVISTDPEGWKARLREKARVLEEAGVVRIGDAPGEANWKSREED